MSDPMTDTCPPECECKRCPRCGSDDWVDYSGTELPTPRYYCRACSSNFDFPSSEDSR